MDRTAARKRAEELVSKMTLEEKASQLRYDSPAIERLGIPEYNWWNEALHGVARAGTATVFPQAIAMAAAFDAPMMKEIGDAIADEGRAKYNEQAKRGDRDIYKGLTFWSPNVNIFRDPRWGRGHETYGEDPYLTSRLGVNFVEGLQGDGEYMHAAACAKHFAVHSGPEAERHHFNAVASKKDMEETYLPAFEACVKEAKVEAVMGAYNRTNGEVCCGSPTLQKILRGKWGFQGHFVSDCWAIRDFHEHHKITNSPEESVTLALENGTDVNCGCTYQKILSAHEKGMIDEKYITESCIRLFTTRYLLGLFDETEYDKVPYTEVESPAHLSLADRAAREGIVLLKNDGVLPLSIGKLSSIGVIGPNANARAALIGNYHGTASRYVTILEGIQDAAAAENRRRSEAGNAADDGNGSLRVFYSQGCDLSKDNVEPLSKPELADRFAEALTVADYSDVTILVIGLDETLEGEEGDDGNAYFSGDKKDLKIPPFQYEMVRNVLRHTKETGKKSILVNVSGSALDLSVGEELADAVVQVFYPGASGGSAAADILFGKASPSGKLPVTFYHDEDKLPDFEDYSMQGRTYRYFDGTPLYPFGYGLTYGDCSVDGMEVTVPDAGLVYDPDEAEPAAEATASVCVHVRNDGSMATDDVLQLYIRDEEYEGAVPHPALCGFTRVSLAPGEEKDVTLAVRARAFTSVDDDGLRLIRSHRFTLYAGFQQPDERSHALTGHECASGEVTI